MSLMAIVISGILVNNFCLARFLGMCPFLGLTKNTEASVGMGIAVTFVLGVSSIVCYLIYSLVLVPLNIVFLYNIAFILVIAALVQFVEMVIKKKSPALYKTLGIYLPLITTNCAILGAIIINMTSNYNLIQSVTFGISSGLGFMLAMVLLSTLRERIDKNETMPEAMKGLPIGIITAALMAMAFMGFQGLVK